MKRKLQRKRFLVKWISDIHFEVFNHTPKALNCFIRLSKCHPYLINCSIIRNSYLLTNLHKHNSITLAIFFSLLLPTAVERIISLLIRWRHSIEGNLRDFRWYRLIWFLSILSFFLRREKIKTFLTFEWRLKNFKLFFSPLFTRSMHCTL